MSNINAPTGLQWVGHRRGMPISGCLNTYIVPASDGTALYVGDGVKLAGDSEVDNTGVYKPTVIQAAATDTMVGVVAGFLPDTNYLNQLYRTGLTKRIALVIDDPDAIFSIQGYGAAATSTMIGNNADIYVGSGSTVTGYSGMEIDLTTVGSGSAQLRIIGVDSLELGAYAKLLVYINEHRYRTTTGV